MPPPPSPNPQIFNPNPPLSLSLCLRELLPPSTHPPLPPPPVIAAASASASCRRLCFLPRSPPLPPARSGSPSAFIAARSASAASKWVPPSLSVPILDLVDVVFQLQDGGWIRRKAFWVAKQVLQLGMGDAFDDWLIEKIQLLRRGTVVASGIRRIEQILWPDGIFITKHPRRQRPTASGNTPLRSTDGQPPISVYSPKKIEDVHQWEEQQLKEAERRAKFVYDLMIDNAPAAIVSLFGRKEYEQCAKDLYYFIQVHLRVGTW
ncbi:uncharacterized protein LOC127801478 [Diospyros lotus]|uniref:uncharacterized protein LOC127801478 n=1 Tax=Diospyros lotus TaxID=55363 RepID=UPI00225A1918|nr:uncharacterized protein LOC127801478 [Diospyros lotus]